jgi:hypothetical protein
MRDLIIPLAISFFALLSLAPLFFERTDPQDLDDMGIQL